MMPGITIVTLALIGSLSASGQQAQTYRIDSWPATLRTDLRGTSLKVVLPENAPDRPWDDALMSKFQELTGINVEIIRPGNDTTAALAKYLRDFRSGAPEGDVYAIDIVWPGILSDYAEDLRPSFPDLNAMLPSLVENDSVRGKLVAVPYFVEVSLLYYRSDLLTKYNFKHPPQTWSELEHQARVIQAGERAAGNGQFWGYLWQGATSEALTCNALEWQASQAGGRLVKPDGSLDYDREHTAAALEHARKWVGKISPSDVTNQLEDNSLSIWKHGDAAFMRNWPYAFLESGAADSAVANHVGVTVLPMGDGPGSRHADTLGGFQLMVSNKSKNKAAAVELIRFLTSPEIQRVNAATRGYAPTILGLYDDATVLEANSLFSVLKDVLVEGALTRPSTAAGTQYDRLSEEYFSTVHRVLTGEKSATVAAREIEEMLSRALPSRTPAEESRSVKPVPATGAQNP
jgi:trehalose/maltose transport system substrate-binding protein